jgi:hypothetical protein
MNGCSNAASEYSNVANGYSNAAGENSDAANEYSSAPMKRRERQTNIQMWQMKIQMRPRRGLKSHFH